MIIKSKRTIILILLVTVILGANLTVVANNLPFQDYRIALRAIEDGNWQNAHNYLDRVIARDYASSNYLAKSIYLKSMLLTAEIDRDLRLKDAFLTGYEGLDVEEEELRKEYKELVETYERDAKRRVDTLIGLANYLLHNLPPVEIELENFQAGSGYSEADLTEIKSGSLISETDLNQLKHGLFADRIGHYFTSTLGLRADIFDNVHTIRARSGDSLSNISQKYDLPLPLLIRANDHIQNPDRIYPNERIYLPRTKNSYIDYPAYFYHLSHLAYRANPERREEVMRMVVRAYQLTGAREQIDSEAKALIYEMEADDYRIQIEESTEYYQQQDQELAELREDYQNLMEEFKRLREELEGSEEEEGQREESESSLDLSY